jgi:hypothetical protein
MAAKPVQFHGEAAAELEDAVRFYDARISGLGQALLTEVEHVAARIEEHPHMGAPYKGSGLRHYVLRRFPYSSTWS